jgi:hypothetical protein
MIVVRLAAIIACVTIAVAVHTAPSGQDLGSVKVTAARANVRSQPNDKATVVSQVTAGTVLALKAIEGDWFRVQLPMGGIRIEAYISKKVSVVEKAPPPPVAAAPAPAAPTGPDVGITVLWQQKSGGTWMTPTETRVWQLGERAESVRAMAAALPKELHAPIAAGDTVVSYVWTIEPSAASFVVADRRPTFIVQFKDVSVATGEIEPVLVRLAAAPSGVKVVAVARGRADEIARTAAEWDVARDLRHDLVRSAVKVLPPGAVLEPAEDLVTGDYAIVVRPPRKRLPGAAVLTGSGEGRMFAAVWTFRIE